MPTLSALRYVRPPISSGLHLDAAAGEVFSHWGSRRSVERRGPISGELSAAPQELTCTLAAVLWIRVRHATEVHAQTLSYLQRRCVIYIQGGNFQQVDFRAAPLLDHTLFGSWTGVACTLMRHAS